MLFEPHCRSSRHVATASLSGRQTLPALHFAIRNAPYLSQRRKMIPKTTREVNENSIRINSRGDSGWGGGRGILFECVVIGMVVAHWA